MTFKKVVLMGMIISAVGVSGCTKPPATVNGKAISREMVDLQVKERVMQHKGQNVSVDAKQLRESVVQELINQRLALDEAAAKGITVPDTEVTKEIEGLKQRFGDQEFLKSLKDRGLTETGFRAQLKDNMIIAQFIGSLVKEGDVTEDQMAEYYKNSPKPFIRPARANMKILEFSSEDAARSAVDELKRTKQDFDQFADRLGRENRANVTDYGWVSPEFFSPSMATAIKGLRPGAFGGPYKGQKGFYLVRMKEFEPEGIARYEEVKDMIRNLLLQQKRTAAYMQWIEEKRKSAKIVINLS